MKMRLLSLLIFVTFVAVSAKFHEDLTDDERQHYFGTLDVRSVPDYQYTSPQRIEPKDDVRRRRSPQDSRADTQDFVIRAFGEDIRVTLTQNVDIQAPGCLVHHVAQNGTTHAYPCNSSHVDCYYTGHVQNVTESWVAASVCEGFHGMIQLAESMLLVQPVKEVHLNRARRDTDITNPHIVHRYIRQAGTCAAAESDEDDGTSRRNRRRRRRSTGRKYMETTIVVDASMYRFHGQDTEKMVKTLLNVAAERFLDASLQTKVYMSLVKLMILETDQPGLAISTDAQPTLNSFCHWQSTWNPENDNDPQHADYVALLTRLDLSYRNTPSTVGLANGASVCNKGQMCSVNQDLGLATGLVLAHETGHALGANHDGQGNACTNYTFIMATGAASGPDSFKWSSCSSAAIKTFVESSKASCLNDLPAGQDQAMYGTSTQPGAIYSGDQQCKMALGPEASLCEGEHGANKDGCYQIVCRSTPDGQCFFSAHPRMDGTECGQRKWCIKGACVTMGSGSPGPINGGWGAWEAELSQCSRTCGGGVRVKKRSCNNPEPRYGGQYCTGAGTQAVLCNMQTCGKSEIEFLEEQCTATDSSQLNGRTYHWVPNLSSKGDESCKLSCTQDGANLFYKRGTNVDGSQCRKDGTSLIYKCIGGTCRGFGCDGHADSTAAFDACAVCGGSGNTCTKHSGTAKTGKGHAFTTFVTIPKGSTGIRITQGNTYCYLSIAVNGHRMINDGTPRQSGTYDYAGVHLHYNSHPERLDIVGPLPVDIQAQVYMKYGAGYVGVDPDVYYEYHTSGAHASSDYVWKTQAGKCSKECGTGTQTPHVTCFKQGAGTVADRFCNIYNKPAEVTQTCNTQACPPRWRTSGWTACSKSCGGGTKQRHVECVQENNNVESVLTDQRCSGQAKPSTTANCNTGQCPGSWKPEAWSACSETCARGVKTLTVKCYSSSTSNTPVPDTNCAAAAKPVTREYCVVKPCNTAISGAECKDKVADCFGSYGEEVCNGDYAAWAKSNCMKSCGVCADNPSNYDPDCKDDKDNCAQYNAGFCQATDYKAWAKANCKKFCGYCGGAPATTTPVPPPSSGCQDKSDCAAYGQGVCSEYAAWARTNCQLTCGLCPQTTQPACEDKALDCGALGDDICQQTEFVTKNCRRYCGLCEGCQDQESNCASYGSDMCTAYKPWAGSHCQAFCGLCGSSRKKRSAEEELEPPMEVSYEEPPLIQPIPEDLEVDVPEVNLIESASDVPTEPVCNTVRTTRTGSVDVFGKVLPGVKCVQTIALPLDSRVLLTFDKMNIDCEQGDVLNIVNGDVSKKIQVCTNLLEDTWLSTGSVVVIEFTSGALGHGYAFSYRAFPSNNTVPGCSKHFTAAVGHVTSETTPPPTAVGDNGDVCEVYITGTPGKSIQLSFTSFQLPPRRQGEEGCDGVEVEDLEGGEVDEFCGNLMPFVWESRGARVKITYRQQPEESGFEASYRVQNNP